LLVDFSFFPITFLSFFLLIRATASLSFALLYFAVPHTLEDFAVGEPAEAGVPAVVLSLVVATIFAIQAAGLYWLGSGARRG